MNALTLLTTLLPALVQAGGLLKDAVPQAAPIIQALMGLTQPLQQGNTQQLNIVSLLQDLLNQLQTQGVISFGKPLTVDGQFGGNTFAAIKVLQKRLGVDIQEPAASAEMKLLQSLLAK